MEIPNSEILPPLNGRPRGVRPRDAATLVPLRRNRDNVEILMGRRAGKHRFLPNLYVFPGGRVDDSDHRVTPLSALRHDVHAHLVKESGPARARALAVAAVRETWEETGIVLGQVVEGTLQPALDRLDYLIRAITPAESPIRFHARFFAAQVKENDGEVRSNGELLDLEWRSVADCLKLPVADITEYVLVNLDRLLDGRPREAPVPLFAFRNGRVSIRDAPPRHPSTQIEG
jgi:8-oxo-dGTP pyrophosphatase MutT (NUDIX family)